MIVIPIGQDGAVRRIPVVTIGLIALMTLIHCYTHTAFDRQVRRCQDALEHRNDLVFTYAAELRSRQYDDPGSMDMPDVGHTYGNSMQAMRGYTDQQAERVDAAMESGELYPVDSPEYEEYFDAKEELERAKRSFVFFRFGFVPAKPSLFTIITSMFFHGGILHLLFNMIFLWAAGVMMESSWGHIVYGVGYLISGIAATLIHWLSAPGSAVPCVGASGAIAGMMGAYMIVHFHENVHFIWVAFLGMSFRMGKSKCPAWILLGCWIIGQVSWALIEADLGGGEGGGIAYWAHIGGFGFGVVLALAIRHSGWEAKLHVDGPPPTDEDVRDSMEDVVRRAVALYDEGKMGESQAVIEHILEQGTKVPSAEHLLGRIHAERSEFTKAKVRLENAVMGYCREHSADAALEAFEDLKPNCAEGDIQPSFIFDLARAVENGGYPEKAAELFVEVATQHTSDRFAPKAGLRAGALYEQMGKSGAARQIYRFVEKNASDQFFRDEAQNRIRALEGQIDNELA